jgi:hypothetical protein
MVRIQTVANFGDAATTPPVVPRSATKTIACHSLIICPTFSFIYGMFPFILLSRPVYELLRRPMMTYAPPNQLKLL